MARRETNRFDALQGGELETNATRMIKNNDTKDFNYHSSAFPKFQSVADDGAESEPTGVENQKYVSTATTRQIEQIAAIARLRLFANVVGGLLFLLSCGFIWRIIRAIQTMEELGFPAFIKETLWFSSLGVVAASLTVVVMHFGKLNIIQIDKRYTEAIEYNQRLYSFAHALSSEIKLNDIYSVIAERFVQINGAIIGSLYMIGENNRAYLTATKNVSDEMKRQFAELDLTSTDPFYARHPVVVAYKTGSPAWINTQEQIIAKYNNNEVADVLKATRVNSIMSMPLILNKKIIGVLIVGLEGSDVFSEAMKTFSLSAATLAAQAIDKGRHYQEAQNAIRLRDDFLSIASHELKTPISSLHLQLQAAMHHLYKDFDKSNPQVPYRTLESAVRSTTKLANLIDELLNVARIASGNFTIEFESVDISALVHEILFRFSETIKQQEYKVTFNSSPGTFVMVDRMKADQVITNLISNAIKYGAGNPIHIGIKRQKGFAEISVADNGIGIALEDHETIFKRYTRVAKDPSVVGFGLGLWIVNKIVTQMNGNIHLQSKLGEGSVFTVRFPLSPGGIHDASSGG